MAHNNWFVLEKLIQALDDKSVDIYLHIDKKVHEFDYDRFLLIPQKAHIYIFSKYKVYWGGYSQIKTELFLLKMATKTHHDYYHLLSGQDYLIDNFQNIDGFFSSKPNTEYLDFARTEKEKYIQRIQVFHFFQECPFKGFPSLVRLFLGKLNSLSYKLQQEVKKKRNMSLKVYVGSQWFDVTHECAIFLLSKKTYIKRHFSFTSCADEIFLPTLLMNFPNNLKIENRSLRHIDFSRGNGSNPYTFTIDDYDELMSSKKLFARKFSDKNIDVVERIEKQLLNK